MQNNKNYQITFLGWNTLKEEVGEDVVFFEAQVALLVQSDSSFTVSMPFRLFRKYLIEQIPSAQHVLDQTTKHISKWGMQESVYVRDLLDCGVDLSSLFVQYIRTAVDLDAEAERNRKLALLSNDSLQSVAAPLEASVAEMRTKQEEYYTLCKHIEKQLTVMLLNEYPQVFNSSSDTIRNLESIFVKHIPRLATDLQHEINNLQE